GVFSAGGSYTVIRNVRSESYILTSGGANVVENCDVHAPLGFLGWSPTTAYFQGQVLSTVGAGTNADGRAFICVQSGTSGGCAPNWGSAAHGGFGPGAGLAGAAINSGSAIIDSIGNLFTGSTQPLMNIGDVVRI